jgi:hypothetical protein
MLQRFSHPEGTGGEEHWGTEGRTTLAGSLGVHYEDAPEAMRQALAIGRRHWGGGAQGHGDEVLCV